MVFSLIVGREARDCQGSAKDRCAGNDPKRALYDGKDPHIPGCSRYSFWQGNLCGAYTSSGDQVILLCLRVRSEAQNNSGTVKPEEAA